VRLDLKYIPLPEPMKGDDNDAKKVAIIIVLCLFVVAPVVLSSVAPLRGEKPGGESSRVREGKWRGEALKEFNNPRASSSR